MSLFKDDTSVWVDFPACACLKHILCRTGYDNVSSLKCLNQSNLTDLEQYIEQNREVIGDVTLECNHIQNYKMQKPFKFLPGHKQVLLNWCQNVISDAIITEDKFSLNHPALQPVLREIIIASISNYNKSANIRRFSNLLMKFATYIYILAGKQCYEVLCSNLTLPKSGTICKLFFF